MMFGHRSELWDVAVEADARRRAKFGHPPVEGDPYAGFVIRDGFLGRKWGNPVKGRRLFGRK